MKIVAWNILLSYLTSWEINKFTSLAVEQKLHITICKILAGLWQARRSRMLPWAVLGWPAADQMFSPFWDECQSATLCLHWGWKRSYSFSFYVFSGEGWGLKLTPKLSFHLAEHLLFCKKVSIFSQPWLRGDGKIG